MLVMLVEPRTGGLFAERAGPEFLTVVAILIGLSAGVIAQTLRRRRNPQR
jgi:hypothetical protein